MKIFATQPARNHSAILLLVPGSRVTGNLKTHMDDYGVTQACGLLPGSPSLGLNRLEPLTPFNAIAMSSETSKRTPLRRSRYVQ